MIEDGTALAALVRFTHANDNHELRAEAVRDMIDLFCVELELNRQHKQKHSEDQLTVEIVSNLRTLGVEAAHDPQYGGHCDIVVRASHRFCWIAEAKKHSSYEWLNEGFLQLATRYTTGVPGQDQGEVLIYCKNSDAKAMLDRWRDELLDRQAGIAVYDDPSNPLAFWSKHKHEGSGLPFLARHKVVSLYYRPEK